MTVYYLVLGSNFGFPVSNVLSGINALDRHGRVVSRSSLYLTEPFGRKYQRGFINGAVTFDSDLGPVALLSVLKGIEKKAGRSFTSAKVHRTLDIDVAAAEIICCDAQISIPHPALMDRRFMLVPLCELAPAFPATKDGRTFKEMLDICRDPSEVLKI